MFRVFSERPGMTQHDHIGVRVMEDGLAHWVADLSPRHRMETSTPYDSRFKWVKRCQGTIYTTHILYLLATDGVPTCLWCSFLELE